MRQSRVIGEDARGICLVDSEPVHKMRVFATQPRTGLGIDAVNDPRPKILVRLSGLLDYQERLGQAVFYVRQPWRGSIALFRRVTIRRADFEHAGPRKPNSSGLRV